MKNERTTTPGAPVRLIVIAALAVGVFINTLPAGFVWDDSVVVEKNLFIGKARYLPAVFTPAYFGLFSELSYRPAATLTYFADAALWGRNPLGYHLTNVLLHALATLLFYGVAAKLLESARGGFVAALVFAVHPVHTEAVDGVFAREDILCAVFYFAAVLFFFSAAGCRGQAAATRLAASSLAFLFALFSKEMALSLPALLLALSFLPPLSRQRLRPRTALLAVLLYGSVLGLYLCVRFFLLQNPAEVADRLEPASLLLVPGAVASYLRLVLVPVGLCADRILPAPTAWGLAVSVSTIAGAVLLAALAGRKVPAVTIAAAWFFITIAPVSNLFPLRDPIAERFLYLPSAGACMLLAIPAVARRRSGCVFAAAVIAVFSLMTLQRNRVWKDGLSLWTDTVARSPLSVTARNNLALAYAGEGRIHEAIRELERAVELSPRDAESRINLGSLHALAGSRDRAEAELRLAVRLSPASASAHYNLGRLLDMAGRPGEAAAEYGAALRIRPCHLEARNNLAALYATEGDYRRARAEWGRVLALDPSNPQARNNLRELSAIEGRPRLESRREGRHSP